MADSPLKSARKTTGTTPTQMRLGDDTKAKIEEIRERFGLPSMAAAVRYAVDRTHLGLKKARKS